MFFWTQVVLAFVAGIIVNKLWNALLYTGYSVYILKGLQDNSVKLMASLAQTVSEIQELKAMEYRHAGKSDREIEFHSQIGEKYTKSLKSAIVSDFLRRWPRQYHHMLEFYDWDTAMEYMDKLLKEERVRSFNK